MKHNHMIDSVAEFQKNMNQKDVAELYGKLIQEEYEEWLEEHYNKEKAPEDELKELCDMLYVIFGYALARGWPIDVAFNRVHESNMTKFDKSGKPVYNSDGKVIKGAFYKKPNLEDLV